MNAASDVNGMGWRSCAPCAKAHAWVTAGGIGQWVLAAAGVVFLVVGLRRPVWRPAATIAACGLIPIAAIWFAVSTEIAQRSF